MKTTFLLSMIAAHAMVATAGSTDPPYPELHCHRSEAQHTKGKLVIGEMKDGNVKPERYLYFENMALHMAKQGNSSTPSVQLWECSVPDLYAKYGKEPVGQLRYANDDSRYCLTLRPGNKVQVAECAEIIDPSTKLDTLSEQWFQIAGQTVRHVGKKNSPIQDEAVTKHDNVTKLVESKGDGGKSLFIV